MKKKDNITVEDYNAFSLFLILILLILSENIISMLKFKGKQSKIKTQPTEEKIIEKNLEKSKDKDHMENKEE